MPNFFLGVFNQYYSQTQVQSDFKTGADQPEIYFATVKNKTIGVVTNQTGLMSDKTHLVDFLVKTELKSSLFSHLNMASEVMLMQGQK